VRYAKIFIYQHIYLAVILRITLKVRYNVNPKAGKLRVFLTLFRSKTCFGSSYEPSSG